MRSLEANTWLVLLVYWTTWVHCWGDLGHRTAAYLAAHYLTPAEVRQIQRLTGFEDISDAAVWADRVVRQDHYAYSRPWHYVDVHDMPPGHCGIDVPRDHPARAPDILAAFVNHTALAIGGDSSADQRREAIRFLVHWIGDVHQPLHAEGLAVGGNRIPVRFDGEATNLHAVWDVFIPRKLRRPADDREGARVWAAELYARDESPDRAFRSECHDIGGAFSCILGWARESNALVCSSVLRDGLSSILHQDLGGHYYDSAKVVAEWRVAAAGRRMAVWLRSILLLMGRGADAHPDADQQVLELGTSQNAVEEEYGRMLS